MEGDTEHCHKRPMGHYLNGSLRATNLKMLRCVNGQIVKSECMSIPDSFPAFFARECVVVVGNVTLQDSRMVQDLIAVRTRKLTGTGN